MDSEDKTVLNNETLRTEGKGMVNGEMGSEEPTEEQSPLKRTDPAENEDIGTKGEQRIEEVSTQPKVCAQLVSLYCTLYLASVFAPCAL